ncbi:methyl-accepting chemotaxis protein [Paenibacillus xylaniclasticus]|uniref:methyl-accepting chemotaxis protein n=1 Tax=Paenibacillus xylaniclasticus TaxID=588083 RepID=UPI000FD9BE6B|nr:MULTISPECIES: methyl-accepting chemotaxis protein [Paenibacillus]GFN31375.1 hypothetical protein PCURB6_16350 [Paenibacillus curdlanolyticus]
MLGIDINAAAVKSMASESLKKSTPYFIGMGVLTLIAIFIVGYLLFRALRPLRWITQSVELIADSKFAEANHIMKQHQIRSRDEIGTMYQYVANMSERLNGLIRNIVTNIGVASTVIADDARLLSHDAARLVQQNAEVREAARQVETGTESQRAVSRESARAMEGVNVTLQKISESSRLANDASAQALVSAEHGSEMTNGLGAQIQLIAGATSDTAERVAVLQANADQIHAAIQTITGIAAQTQILALNASIEAARAGEHGRGFAVVSSEIHKLADHAGQAVGSIGEMLKQIENESIEIAHAMQRSTIEVDKGQQLSSQLQNALADVVSMFRIVSDQIQEITAGTGQLSASAEQVGASISEIAHIAQQSADRMKLIGEQTDSQHERVQRVSQAAEHLNNMTSKLQGTVKEVTV